MIGTRTAVFAPVRDLGLVVLDEAHDGAYKADRTPALRHPVGGRSRAALTGARLVLATATPDVVAVHRVRVGDARRAQLAERRVGARPMVDIVDMRAELAEGNRSVLSRALSDALADSPDGQQAILLINRRGAATFVMCRDCGEPIRCPDCQLPMVHHLATAELRCHHDGRTAPVPTRCPHCHSPRIRYFGAGTQRVEAEVRAQHPRLRVGRLDSDAVAARRRFESIYDDFAAGRTDVLVGTQLAAKGLDLPPSPWPRWWPPTSRSTSPSTRPRSARSSSSPRWPGRAGRGPPPGQVLIQTYAPEHPAVIAAARLDVDGFVDGELPAARGVRLSAVRRAGPAAGGRRRPVRARKRAKRCRGRGCRRGGRGPRPGSRPGSRGGPVDGAGRSWSGPPPTPSERRPWSGCRPGSASTSTPGSLL